MGLVELAGMEDMVWVEEVQVQEVQEEQEEEQEEQEEQYFYSQRPRHTSRSHHCCRMLHLRRRGNFHKNLHRPICSNSTCRQWLMPV